MCQGKGLPGRAQRSNQRKSGPIKPNQTHFVDEQGQGEPARIKVPMFAERVSSKVGFW
jgi:hypothetical protein